MGYVGNQTTNAYTSITKQDITGNGGTAYTLDHAVANANEIEVFVNNVRQEPAAAYTVSGTALTMTGNVTASDDFYVVFQGKAVGTVVPPDDSVTTARIVDDAVTTDKINDGAVTTAKIASGVLPSTSNVLEVVPLIADGQAATFNGTSYTLSNVTAQQSLTTTYADITGTSVSYVPPSGATAVLYEVTFTFNGTTDSSYALGHFKFYVGSVEVTGSRFTTGANSSLECPVTFRCVIPIGGSSDSATGRMSSWTTAQTLKLQGREYGSGNQARVNGTHHFDGTGSNQVFKPRVTITAYGAS